MFLIYNKYYFLIKKNYQITNIVINESCKCLIKNFPESMIFLNRHNIQRNLYLHCKN